MIKENIEILEKEIKKLSNEKMTMTNAEAIARCYASKIALESLLAEQEGNYTTLQHKTATEGEFQKVEGYNPVPTLSIFYNAHSGHNLKKVCLEIKELCDSVYATLESEEEKNIFAEFLNTF